MLTNQTGEWRGATADVTTNASGNITNVEIVSSGSGYSNGSTLYFDESTLSKGSENATFIVGTTNGVDTTLQFTGIGTVADSYYRVSSVPSSTQVAIAKSAADSDIVAGQYAIEIGPIVIAAKTDGSGTTDTFNTTSSNFPHGLIAGNKFQVNDSSDNKLGTFVVKSVTSPYIFTSDTNIPSGSYNVKIIRQGYSSNQKSSDESNENLGARSISFYDSEYAKIGGSVMMLRGDKTVEVDLPSSLPDPDIIKRFPYGSYIEIDDGDENREIMRVALPTLKGASSNKLTVIRGALATGISSHPVGSLIKKIKPIPVEFRRPSILRASGHTFEYLGYGPGNYSTSLPQLQDKTLTDNEEYLAQSQEKSAGAVVYTGMNSKGDFYIGNTKKSALTGEETNFDVPLPTIT